MCQQGNVNAKRNSLAGLATDVRYYFNHALHVHISNTNRINSWQCIAKLRLNVACPNLHQLLPVRIEFKVNPSR